MRKGFLALLLVLAVTCNTGALGLGDLLSRMNWGSCFRLRIGLCRTIPPKLKIVYWQPEYIVEVVHSPYQSHVPVFSSALSLVSRPGREAVLSVINALGGYGVSAPVESGYLLSPAQTGSRFYEVHIFPVPLDLVVRIFPAARFLPCSWKGWDSLVVNWLSEVDFVNWRLAADLLSVKRFLASLAATYSAGFVCPLNACVGHWGTLYPRRGFVYTRNDFVGGALAAWRAYHWACRSSTAVRIKGLKGCTTDRDDVKMQLAYPSVTKCIHPGDSLLAMEAGHVASSYIWIIWRKRKCCVGSFKHVAALLAMSAAPEAVAALNALEDVASVLMSAKNAAVLVTSKIPEFTQLARWAVEEMRK